MSRRIACTRGFCTITVGIAIALLVMGLGAVASAQTLPLMPGGGKAEPLPPHDAASVVKYYGDKGYSVIGPVKIVSVTQDVITLPTFPESEKNPISVYLTGRTVTLKSFGSTDSATETLQPGEMVIICQKDKQVVIYRLGRQKASGSEMNDANR